MSNTLSMPARSTSSVTRWAGSSASRSPLAHPDRVRRLVLVGASAGIDRSLPVLPRLWGNAITGPLIRRLRITAAETLRKRVYAPLLVAHPEEVPLELLAMDIAAAALPGVDCFLHDAASRHHLARVPAEPDDAGGAGPPGGVNPVCVGRFGCVRPAVERPGHGGQHA